QLGGALEAELEEGVAVERGNGALGIERQDSLAPGGHQLRPAVEAHHEGVLEAVQEQPVLDHLGGHVDQHQRVLLCAVGLAGGVQDRHQLAPVVENRSGTAGQPDIAGEEVLVAMDDERGALEQARAHAVGATVFLAPHGAQDQAGAKGGVTEAQVPVVIQQHAVPVGEDDRVARAGELVVQVRHLGVGEGDQLEVLLLAGQPLLPRQHVGLPLGLGIQLVLGEAAQPGALDVVRRAGTVFPRGSSQHRLNVTGVTADRLELHGLPPQVCGGAPRDGASYHVRAALCHVSPTRHGEDHIRYSALPCCSLLEQCQPELNRPAAGATAGPVKSTSQARRLSRTLADRSVFERGTMKTKAAIAYAAGKPLEVVTLDLAGPKAGEVMIEIKASGVCHTDEFTRSGADPEGLFPVVFGHEGAGIVVEVGPGVTSLKKGDHVILLYTPECRQCKSCTSHKTNLCTSIRATQGKGVMRDGTSRFSLDGKMVHHYMGCSTFSNFTVLPEIAVAKIREDAPFEKVCYIGCGVTTGIGAVTHTAKVESGANVVVFGLGGIGLNVIQGARLVGANKIIGVDVNPRRK